MESLRQELTQALAGGWRQQEVATLTGIAQSAISAFVTGKRGLNGEAALKLLGFLRRRRKAIREDQMSA